MTTPITRRDVIAHQAVVPWPSQIQVEQDLLLCRAMVVLRDRPEGHIRKALNRVLKGVLGTPKQSAWADLKLAIRNTVKPSRVLRMTYAIPSLVEPGTNLEIVVEANVTERTPHLPVIKIPFEFPFQDTVVSTKVCGYDIHEMLGTKMRALFQRRRGRDLFDLYWELT